MCACLVGGGGGGVAEMNIIFRPNMNFKMLEKSRRLLYLLGKINHFNVCPGNKITVHGAVQNMRLHVHVYSVYSIFQDPNQLIQMWS